MRSLADVVARLPMVQEEPDVEVVAQVHLEQQALLAHRAHRGRRIEAFVLVEPLLPPPELAVQPIGRDRKALQDLLRGERLERTALLVRVILGAVVEPGDHVAVVPVHDQRELRDVALIDTEALHVEPPRPFAQVTEALLEPVREHGVVPTV